MTVTNCNLTSHACAVRLGWINDGVIRNCTFSNLNITDTFSGLTAYLPGNPADARMSDEGREATLIENITFTNITFDRTYSYPIRIHIAEDNMCNAIRNLYFSNIHAFSGKMPVVKGRPDCHVQNIYFSDCHFTQVPYASMGTKFSDRLAKFGAKLDPVTFRYVDNLVLNNTTFTTL